MGGYGMAGADLRGVAEGTGGGYVYLTGEDQVDAVFSAIGEELRHQYILGFTPSGGIAGNHTIAVSSRLADTTVRFRRVSMEMPVGSPLVAGAVVRQGATLVSALPSSMAAGSAANMSAVKPPAANLAPPKRTAFWDTLDAFTHADWAANVAKRMTIDELRSFNGMLRNDAEDWIRAAPPAEVAQRRLAAAAFVLDVLYSQNDPFLWMDKQPAPDLLDWAVNQLQANAPSPQERLWYFGALALCERGGAFDNLERVAYRAWRRFPDEGRFLLARGVAQDLRTWPEERDLRVFNPAPDIASALIARYEEAAAIPSVRNEALLRLAFFEVRRGRPLDALKRLDAIQNDSSGADTDEGLAFWTALVRGRALELAGQFDVAAERFAAALDIAPSATSARAALVAALAKAGRAADAAKVANDFLSSPAADRDPWTMYVLPDMRFWTALSTELRKAVVR
jgi:tetratricopeptide (TPR) repeat protein